MNISTTITGEDDAGTVVWPALPYNAWQETRDTLHMWTQIVGKVKMELVPFLNEWWNIGLMVAPRGLTTGTIPFGWRAFEVNFDFIEHQLIIRVSDGNTTSIPLIPRSVADFYQEFMAALHGLGIEVRIYKKPVEVAGPIPFDEDFVHAAYDPTFVTRFWRILLQVDRLLQQFRTPFVGKSSPVLFWWGGFDLTASRFSGRAAPVRDFPVRWMALAEEQEYTSVGFWPGSKRFPEPAFYAFTSPAPPGYSQAPIQPDPAFFHQKMGEFLLPYDEVRTSAAPEQLMRDFFESSYEIGATLAGWDRATLERERSLASGAKALPG